MKLIVAILFLGSVCSAQVAVQCPAFPCTITVTAPAPPPLCNPPNTLVNGVCTPPAPPPVVTITPTALTFSAALNTDSPIQLVTVKNPGSSAIPLTSSMSGAPFNWGGSGTCSGVSLAANSSCTISALYHPTSTTAATGTLTINSGTPSTTTVVKFSGSVPVAPPVLKPNLSWSASITPGVTYNVYRSTVKGGPYAVLNASPITGLTYRDATAVSGTTYFYVATSVQGSQESVKSNEITVMVP